MSLVPNVSTDPTVELGNAATGIVPWSSFYQTAEDVAELSWPESVYTYNKMRNDEQIAALLLAFMLPIFGYRWYIDPNGARDEVVQHVASDFGLPIEGQDPPPQGRRRDRFSMSDYLYHSMLKLPFGFMFFEQVYRYGSDGKLHIRKLAPRLPGSISQVQVAPDGGLLYIRQYAAGYNFDPAVPLGGQADVLVHNGIRSPIIPVDRLIAHVNEKEGGNWFGRPWLRSVYRNWLLKDRLLRVDAMKHERNGMGVPTIEAPQNASQSQMAQLAKLAQQYKSGEASGGALPYGAKLKLNGVSGSLPDTLASIKYHDEQVARRFLAMFTMLGSTQTGSRALGNTFVDFFGMAQQSVAKTFADTTNEHAIEDLVDLNYGIDEGVPLLRFRPESDRGLPAADLVALIQVGAITADADLEDYIRAENDLPEKDQNNDAIAPPAQETDPAASNRERQKIKAAVRPQAAKQREANGIEKQSKVDFAALRKAFDQALADLVDQWKTEVKGPQVNELVASIAATAPDDLTALANLSVTPKGADILSLSAQGLAATASEQAVKEITDQGVDLAAPDLAQLNQLLSDRAAAVQVVMANALSQSASSAALAQAGGVLTSTDIAMSVGDHLDSLSDAYLNDQLGGALMQAQNASRRTVFDLVPNKNLYASELADTPNCCGTFDPPTGCRGVDGTEYATMDDAEADYPNGGFKDCEGDYRCRGTIICTSGLESDPSVE